jgi:hypothetical protein
MSLEDAVVMAPSLEEAAIKLEQELRRKSDRLEKRLPASPPTQIQEIPADDIKNKEEEETKELSKEKK